MRERPGHLQDADLRPLGGGGVRAGEARAVAGDARVTGEGPRRAGRVVAEFARANIQVLEPGVADRRDVDRGDRHRVDERRVVAAGGVQAEELDRVRARSDGEVVGSVTLVVVGARFEGADDVVVDQDLEILVVVAAAAAALRGVERDRVGPGRPVGHRLRERPGHLQDADLRPLGGGGVRAGEARAVAGDARVTGEVPRRAGRVVTEIARANIHGLEPDVADRRDGRHQLAAFEILEMEHGSATTSRLRGGFATVGLGERAEGHQGQQSSHRKRLSQECRGESRVNDPSKDQQPALIGLGSPESSRAALIPRRSSSPLCDTTFEKAKRAPPPVPRDAKKT